MSASFRQTLIAKLADRGVDEDSVADSLAHVIKGERVKKVYRMDKKGVAQLDSVEVITTPKDAAQGALLYDTLRGGDLGLAPREGRRTHAIGDLHRRFAPVVDERIVPVKNFFEHPVEGDQLQAKPVADQVEPVTEPTPVTPSDVLESIASEDDNSDEEEDGFF